MSQQAWRAARPGGVRVRAYALLVLAVLAGLVAMHGLAPAGSSPAPSHAVAAADAHHGVAAAMGCEGCAHAEHAGHAQRVAHGDAGGGGHAEHADATCAAGGTSTAPALPALAPAGAVTCATADLTALVPAATPGGRAPPSLSELQLLRI
ncbi:DUF6153 family protein [Streptomyces ficellus]|uniref:DUF6153 family protein n=1 Tax=Streptomyces ficellus TaxID=1977088 RepID=A0ABT7Z4B1_9ACTN|nr:DUF6153 family protein [Streptomyces ficellus]MDN3294348.1 DUF6153 family protein [Streptomyces ficellus]